MYSTLQQIIAEGRDIATDELNLPANRMAAHELQVRLCDFGLLDPVINGDKDKPFGPVGKGDGMIGVKRHQYWYWLFGKHYFLAATQYKIHLLGANIDFYDTGNITNPGSVVGFTLFEVFEQMGIPYSGHVDDKTNEHTRDRWA